MREYSMELKDEIDNYRNEIRTDGYSMSIGEWISLYEGEEIDIHPEYQRFYRWTIEQKSKLIESILLGIPIPQIFVSQRNDGIWDVVDGLQRLSTLYSFVGILKDADGKVFPPLKLEATNYLPSLKDKFWDDPSSQKSSFTFEQRLLVKRAKISVSIILRESDSRTKFDLFQRLNTGGSSLTEQEVRNCILVMINNNFYRWLKNISQYEPFQESISISDRLIAEQYDIELALRFLVLANIKEEELSRIGDIGDFLSQQMQILAQNTTFDYEKYSSQFKKTFDYIYQNTNGPAFIKYSGEKDKFMGGFILSAFEVIACGIGYNIEQTRQDTIIDKIKQLWSNDLYTQWSGSGITATRRLPKLIPLGRKLFG